MLVIGGPTTEGGEDIVPNASFSLLGGTDIVCLGAGTEGKEWHCLASDRIHVFERGSLMQQVRSGVK